VAILLRVGVQGISAVELARQILKKFGSLRAVAEAPLSALLDVKGLKGAKAAQLAAAMEVARRVSLPDGRERVKLRRTREAAEYLRSRLSGLSEEHFRALFLNRKSMLLEDALLAIGSVDQARPPLRLIIARVLQANASAVIIGTTTRPAQRSRASRTGSSRKTCLVHSSPSVSSCWIMSLSVMRLFSVLLTAGS
jgi:DNA repair protein RadC